MKLTLLEKHILTPDVRSYDFEHEPGFTFKPGQFVMLRQPGAEPKLNRAFSMASTSANNRVTFLMKHIPDGHVSGYLASANLGAQLEAGPAVGRFTLNPTDSDRVFIATGTGLAPIISFIEHLAMQPDNIPFVTLFGVRSEDQLFWTEKLPAGSIVTLSQPSPTWAGERGRVTHHIQTLHALHPEAAWYLCGSPDMVKDTNTQLTQLGVPSTAIHFEVY